MDRCGTRLEALESGYTWFLDFIVRGEDLRHGACFFRGLAVKEVYGETFGISDSDHVTPAWGIRKFLNRARGGEFSSPMDWSVPSYPKWQDILSPLLQFCETLYLECASQKLLFSLLSIIYILVGAIATEPSLPVRLLRHIHSKVAHKGRDLCQIGVLVAHVRDTRDFDLRIAINVLGLLPLDEGFADWGDGLFLRLRGAACGRSITGRVLSLCQFTSSRTCKAINWAGIRLRNVQDVHWE